MIDIETLGLREDCVITSIAAVPFDLTQGAISVPFYKRIHLSQPGRNIEQGTFIWWMQQETPSRDAWMKGDKTNLDDALRELSAYIYSIGLPEETAMWARGINFDYTILSHAYSQNLMPTPWRYTNLADVRTFDAVVPREVIDNTFKVGSHHHAVDDCYFQINYVLNSLAYIRSKA